MISIFLTIKSKMQKILYNLCKDGRKQLREKYRISETTTAYTHWVIAIKGCKLNDVMEELEVFIRIFLNKTTGFIVKDDFGNTIVRPGGYGWVYTELYALEDTIEIEVQLGNIIHDLKNAVDRYNLDKGKSLLELSDELRDLCNFSYQTLPCCVTYKGLDNSEFKPEMLLDNRYKDNTLDIFNDKLIFHKYLRLSDSKTCTVVDNKIFISDDDSDRCDLMVNNIALDMEYGYSGEALKERQQPKLW